MDFLLALYSLPVSWGNLDGARTFPSSCSSKDKTCLSHILARRNKYRALADDFNGRQGDEETSWESGSVRGRRRSGKDTVLAADSALRCARSRRQYFGLEWGLMFSFRRAPSDALRLNHEHMYRWVGFDAGAAMYYYGNYTTGYPCAAEVK